RLGRTVPPDRLFVRLNGLHAKSGEEITRAIDAGVRFIMQPNFTQLSELEIFARLVDRSRSEEPAGGSRHADHEFHLRDGARRQASLRFGRPGPRLRSRSASTL